MADEAAVYVELLGEGPAWSAVVAKRVNESVFQLPDEAPEGERWAFEPGSLVVVEMREFPDGPAFVAIGVVD